jgi:hypothetical protein
MDAEVADCRPAPSYSIDKRPSGQRLYIDHLDLKSWFQTDVQGGPGSVEPPLGSQTGGKLTC